MMHDRDFCEDMRCPRLFLCDDGECFGVASCPHVEAFKMRGCVMMIGGDDEAHFVALLPGRTIN